MAPGLMIGAICVRKGSFERAVSKGMLRPWRTEKSGDGWESRTSPIQGAPGLADPLRLKLSRSCPWTGRPPRPSWPNGSDSPANGSWHLRQLAGTATSRRRRAAAVATVRGRPRTGATSGIRPRPTRSSPKPAGPPRTSSRGGSSTRCARYWNGAVDRSARVARGLVPLPDPGLVTAGAGRHRTRGGRGLPASLRRPPIRTNGRDRAGGRLVAWGVPHMTGEEQ